MVQAFPQNCWLSPGVSAELYGLCGTQEIKRQKCLFVPVPTRILMLWLSERLFATCRVRAVANSLDFDDGGGLDARSVLNRGDGGMQGVMCTVARGVVRIVVVELRECFLASRACVLGTLTIITVRSIGDDDGGEGCEQGYWQSVKAGGLTPRPSWY